LARIASLYKQLEINSWDIKLS